MISSSYCQDDGGHLCARHSDDEIPIWILRFNIIDRETHYPVGFANVEIFGNNRGDGFKWQANSQGVAVFMVTDQNCIPYEGTVEITSRDYRYYTIPIKRYNFSSLEDDKRIYLEGHRHNWTSTHEIPKPQEIFDKISEKRYQIGVKTIQYQGVINLVNFAPACFEYEIELDRVERKLNQPRRNLEYQYRRNEWTNQNTQIPSYDTREEDCYTAYEFTVGQILSSEYVYDICKGKGSPGYIYSSAEYSIRDMGSYTAYDYECIYCK